MDILQNHPIELATNVVSFQGQTYAQLQVRAPAKPEKRMGAAIICVLDISGSMDIEATQAGKAESDGFTRLDLVKHSVNTIIHSLDAGDYLGIVTFSTKARTDMKLTQMNQGGKNRALDVVKAMKTEGCTNLWDGIRHGLDLSKDKICQNKNTFVIVLSDGQPNQHPQGGQLNAAKSYIQAHPLTCSMSMFGYGYNLDTNLLSSLTELGGGCYGYIPDCSFVGTIFVNFISLVLSTCTPRLAVQVESQKAQVIQINNIKSSRVNLGPVQFGSIRNTLIKLNAPPGIEDLCHIKIRYGSTLRMEANIKVKNEQAGSSKKVREQILRYNHISLLQNLQMTAEQNLNDTKGLIEPHYENLNKFYQEFGKEDKFINGLMRDLKSDNEQQGQVSIAISKQQYWNKWGVHYLPALQIAHELQLCTNFKDPGIQSYIGPMFDQIQDKIDTIFIKLPPPQPSIKKYDQHGNLHAVDDMADYYDQYGGCIHGDCMVKMSNGVLKPVRNILPGQQITTSKGKSIIKCIIKTPMNQNLDMIHFQSGLIITKYHPIIHEGEWKFPIDVSAPKKIYVDNFYNFVLQNGHNIIINDIACITLGHQIEEKIAKHQFLGTKRVIEDLQKINGWRTGIVEVAHEMFRRDPVTHQIIGIY